MNISSRAEILLYFDMFVCIPLLKGPSWSSPTLSKINKVQKLQIQRYLPTAKMYSLPYHVAKSQTVFSNLAILK